MKASPDKTVDTDNVDNATADTNVVGDSGTAVLECDNVIVLSSESEADEEEARVHGGKEVEQEQEELKEEEEVSRPRKSKKKHKKHHHGGSRSGKKHKKRPKQESGAIFLWAKKEETKILKIYCEDYDPGIKLTKTNGVWSSSPRSKVLAAAQSRSSVCVDAGESQNACDESAEQKSRPDDRIKESPKSGEPIFVDLNDNSIDFVDTISSGEDDEEVQTRARIDRALETIERDPALMNDVKIPLPTIDATAAIKLPEGTTIHQIKVENVANNGAVSGTTPPPKTLPVQRKLGEVTITPQQQQQNEPLNLQTVSKRSALEIRLQEPPLKRKRVDKLPAQSPLASGQVKREWDPLSELKEVLSDPGLCVPDPLLVPRARLAALVVSPATEIPKLLRKPSKLPPPIPDNDLLAVSLSHLRSILQQQPGFADDRKPDSNQPSNIDQMMWLSYLSKDMAGVDTDLISTMLSILLPNSTTAQQSFSYPQDKSQWNDMYYGGNIEPSYGSTPGYSKSGDCCASVSPLPPPPPPPPPPQQILPPPQQPHQLLLPPSQTQILPPPTAVQPPILSPQQPQKHQQSQLLPPSHVQQQVSRHVSKRSLRHNTTPQMRLSAHPPQIPQQLPSRPQQLMPPQLQQPVLHRKSKRRACQELCCNGSPSSCYGGSCCPKSSSYPFTAATPNGCNPFTVSPGDCNPFTATPTASFVGSNPKTCAPYAAPSVMPTCCFPTEIGCAYNGQSPSPMPPRNTSVSPRNRAQFNYQTGPGQQLQQQMSMTEGGSGVNGCCIGATSCSSGVAGCSSGVVACSSGVVGCSSGVSCSISSGVAGSSNGVASSSRGVNSSVSGCTVGNISIDYQCSTATNKPKTPLSVTSTSGDAGQPVHRPKIKVKEHLIDPNAKPRLLNIEGALHLAAGHDLFSSSLWHPLFGR